MGFGKKCWHKKDKSRDLARYFYGQRLKEQQQSGSNRFGIAVERDRVQVHLLLTEIESNNLTSIVSCSLPSQAPPLKRGPNSCRPTAPQMKCLLLLSSAWSLRISHTRGACSDLAAALATEARTTLLAWPRYQLSPTRGRPSWSMASRRRAPLSPCR